MKRTVLNLPYKSPRSPKSLKVKDFEVPFLFDYSKDKVKKCKINIKKNKSYLSNELPPPSQPTTTRSLDMPLLHADNVGDCKISAKKNRIRCPNNTSTPSEASKVKGLDMPLLCFDNDLEVADNVGCKFNAKTKVTLRPNNTSTPSEASKVKGLDMPLLCSDDDLEVADNVGCKFNTRTKISLDPDIISTASKGKDLDMPLLCCDLEVIDNVETFDTNVNNKSHSLKKLSPSPKNSNARDLDMPLLLQSVDSNLEDTAESCTTNMKRKIPDPYNETSPPQKMFKMKDQNTSLLFEDRDNERIATTDDVESKTSTNRTIWNLLNKYERLIREDCDVSSMLEDSSRSNTTESESLDDFTALVDSAEFANSFIHRQSDVENILIKFSQLPPQMNDLDEASAISDNVNSCQINKGELQLNSFKRSESSPEDLSKENHVSFSFEDSTRSDAEASYFYFISPDCTFENKNISTQGNIEGDINITNGLSPTEETPNSIDELDLELSNFNICCLNGSDESSCDTMNSNCDILNVGDLENSNIPLDATENVIALDKNDVCNDGEDSIPPMEYVQVTSSDSNNVLETRKEGCTTELSIESKRTEVIVEELKNYVEISQLCDLLDTSMEPDVPEYVDADDINAALNRDHEFQPVSSDSSNVLSNQDDAPVSTNEEVVGKPDPSKANVTSTTQVVVVHAVPNESYVHGNTTKIISRKNNKTIKSESSNAEQTSGMQQDVSSSLMVPYNSVNYNRSRENLQDYDSNCSIPPLPGNNSQIQIYRPPFEEPPSSFQNHSSQHQQYPSQRQECPPQCQRCPPQYQECPQFQEYHPPFHRYPPSFQWHPPSFQEYPSSCQGHTPSFQGYPSSSQGNCSRLQHNRHRPFQNKNYFPPHQHNCPSFQSSPHFYSCPNSPYFTHRHDCQYYNQRYCPLLSCDNRPTCRVGPRQNVTGVGTHNPPGNPRMSGYIKFGREIRHRFERPLTTREVAYMWTTLSDDDKKKYNTKEESG